MATVTLLDVWLHAASDLSDNVALATISLIETPATKAPIRHYANGRYRLITIPGRQSAYQLTFEMPTRVDADQLRSWSGRLLLMRDPLGRKVFGRFQTSQLQEIAMSDTTIVFEVNLLFEEVTHSEEI